MHSSNEVSHVYCSWEFVEAQREMHDARNKQERCQKGVLTMHAVVISFSGGGNSSYEWVIMVDV